MNGKMTQAKKEGLNILAKCAKAMTGTAVNSACFMYLNQDKLPKEAKKLRKF